MLLNFPSEIHNIIVNAAEPSDLMNLRLSSKVLSEPATRRLFSDIHVTPTELSHRAFQSILASPELSKNVGGIKFTTAFYPNILIYDYMEDEEEAVLSESYEEIIQSVGEFPNLRDVYVEFSARCSVEDPGHWYMTKAPESVEFRSKVLKTLFSSLNHPVHPVSKLRSLTIKNLQDHNDGTITSSPDFISTLSRISELRLRIVSEYDTLSPDNGWNMPQMHGFFAELPSLWLSPASQITSLTLHSDIYFGYSPKCDLRGSHFPNLKKLELQDFSFTHDWQLDWILSHGETLEELILNNCPMINSIRNYGPMNEEKYPILPFRGAEHRWHYAQQWSNYFSRIEKKLPKLKKFKLGNFGSYDTSFDGVDWESFDGGDWESFDVDEVERYLSFDKGTGSSPWIEVKDTFETADGMRMDHTPFTLADPFSVVQLEDEIAYQKLMATVNSRAGTYGNHPYTHPVTALLLKDMSKR